MNNIRFRAKDIDGMESTTMFADVIMKDTEILGPMSLHAIPSTCTSQNSFTIA